jgi:hypothetical protein
MNVLCTCDHEQGVHLLERRGWTVCLQTIESVAALGNGTRPRRCPCARFTEAEFAKQQIPLFSDVTTERR